MAAVDYPEQGHEWCVAVEDDSWWFQHRNRVLVDLMRRYPPAQPLYDVGGGNGVVAAALRDAGIRSIVVEPGAAGVQNARKRGLEAIQATLGEAGVPPGTIGSIGVFDVVEHIDDDRAFLAHLRDMLAPGGRLYVTVPSYQSLWSGEDVHAQHFRRYTASGMRRALRAAGFEIEHVSYLFSFLPIPVLLFRTIPYRLGIARPVSAAGVQDDHGGGGSLSRRLLDGVLALERTVIRAVGGLPFGGSVIAVARKRSPAATRDAA
jgi:SAM-dependent methyltransferase